MTRMFLISSIFVLQFSALANCDTLIDVFDESLESQLMVIDAVDIQNETIAKPQPDQQPDGDKVVADRLPQRKFFLASSSKRITKQRITKQRKTKQRKPGLWSPGKYPADLVDGNSIIATHQDEHFLYFASDLAERNKVVEAIGLQNLGNQPSVDQHLKKLPRNARRSARR